MNRRSDLSTDQLRGNVQISVNSEGKHHLHLSGDVPAYIAIDAIGAIVKANSEKARLDRQNNLKRYLGYGLSVFALLLTMGSMALT
ncbi:hypothetical protein Lepto7375DRAFT_1790 [Leptolyngbya sp. PCC 7375]|nr:hypothetical protein Lepto7375DRAFT_1790 [Leptolyngbya sp. PCC 7375]